MIGELMTLPLRVGVRATQVWLRAAEQTFAVVAETTGRLIGRVASDEEPPRRIEPRGDQVEQRPEPAPYDPWPQEPATSEPLHVSEEPELVAEVAEPGAEDGARASVRVQAPWEGYDRMKAADVADRLAGANAAQLAAVRLYETRTKDRRTVLEAVERELRISTRSGSQR
jgi:hypothetical protein